jgi:hypothetical protein
MLDREREREREERRNAEFCSEHLQGRDLLEDVGVYGSIIL